MFLRLALRLGYKTVIANFSDAAKQNILPGLFPLSLILASLTGLYNSTLTLTLLALTFLTELYFIFSAEYPRGYY